MHPGEVDNVTTILWLIPASKAHIVHRLLDSKRVVLPVQTVGTFHEMTLCDCVS